MSVWFPFSLHSFANIMCYYHHPHLQYLHSGRKKNLLSIRWVRLKERDRFRNPLGFHLHLRTESGGDFETVVSVSNKLLHSFPSSLLLLSFSLSSLLSVIFLWVLSLCQYYSNLLFIWYYCFYVHHYHFNNITDLLWLLSSLVFFFSFIIFNSFAIILSLSFSSLLL